MLRKWFFSILVVVIVLLCLPYFMGRTAEQKFKQGVQQFNQRFAAQDIQLTILSYKRGWFDSTAKLDISSMGKDVVVPLRIYHGPIILNSHSLHTFALASMSNSFKASDYTKQLFKKQPPALVKQLQLFSQISMTYNGSIDLRLKVPAIHVKDPKTKEFLNYEGMTIAYHINLSRGYVDGIANSGLAQGRFKGLGALDIQPFVARGVYTRTPYKLWAINSTMDVPALTLKDMHGRTALALKNLNYKIVTHIEGNKLSGQYQMTLSNLNVNGYALGPISTTTDFKNFNSTALANLIDQARAMQSQKMNPALMMMGFAEGLSKIFMPGAQISGPTSITTHEGIVKLDSNVTWPSKQPIMSMAGVLMGANVDLHVSIPKKLVGLILMQVQDHQAKINMNAESKAYKPGHSVKQRISYASIARMQIQQAISQGYIKLVNGQYQSHIQVKHGLITLNGVPYVANDHKRTRQPVARPAHWKQPANHRHQHRQSAM